MTGSIVDGASPLPATINSQSDMRPRGSFTTIEASCSVSRDEGAYSTSTVGSAFGFDEGSLAVFPYGPSVTVAGTQRKFRVLLLLS